MVFMLYDYLFSLSIKLYTSNFSVVSWKVLVKRVEATQIMLHSVAHQRYVCVCVCVCVCSHNLLIHSNGMAYHKTIVYLMYINSLSLLCRSILSSLPRKTVQIKRTVLQLYHPKTLSIALLTMLPTIFLAFSWVVVLEPMWLP